MRASNFLSSLLATTLKELDLTFPQNTVIEPPKDKKFGDLATNCAMLLAKEAKKNPRELAEKISAHLQSASSSIAEASIAGPGFINIRFVPSFWQENINIVEKEGKAFGSSNFGNKEKVQVEFVSANPTGPLHIGHGRGAAIGDSMARILRFNGYDVHSEYYINDAGKQMRTLGTSIWLRALELSCKNGDQPFPETCYQGNYIIDIARDMLAADPTLIARSEAEGIDICYRHGMNVIFSGIKKDLADFRVHFDNWFSELSLEDGDQVNKTLQQLRDNGFIYEKDGATWFRSTAFNDDKDRVLKKSDGYLTYFASDIAYHANKFSRGFTHLIDVWGADHHGYIPRMRAAIQSMGKKDSSFSVILVQLVNLLKDGEQIAMSTRAGKFETLEDVVKEVGTDAARFIFLSRKSDSKLDFDLSLVKQRTMDNPVYYVQYAHARVCTLLRRAEERNISLHEAPALALLEKEEELDLLKAIDRFPQVVHDAATTLSPHFISYYLMDFAGLLHRYYAVHQILGADTPELISARLALIKAAGQVINNGLALLGVEAPESM